MPPLRICEINLVSHIKRNREKDSKLHCTVTAFYSSDRSAPEVVPYIALLARMPSLSNDINDALEIVNFYVDKGDDIDGWHMFFFFFEFKVY